MKRLEGKVVVVTGAARGQGAAEAAALAEAGARVIATDVLPFDEIDFPDVDTRRLDVTSPEDWAELADLLKDEFGEVHGLVNNAGIPYRGRLAEVSPADLDRVMQVNVLGPLLGMQTLLPLMRPGASIVNVGSIAALTGHSSAAYTASKWAVRGLSRVASLELGRLGIRVNTIHPGYIETDMTKAAPPRFRDLSIAEIPLGRVGHVEDMTGIVVFLVSDESAYISGADIPVDGGHAGHGGVKSLSDGLR